MLNELILLFENLKNIKIVKFSNKKNQITDENVVKDIKQKLEEYQDNALVLCELEPYLYNLNDKKDNEYLYNVITMLRYYLSIDEKQLDSELEEKVRNDEKVVEALVLLEQIINNDQSKILYEPVIEEVKKLDDIILSLSAISEDEYINEQLISKIYDYLKNEIYISYEDKFIKTGRLIAMHNIDVSKKRTKGM